MIEEEAERAGPASAPIVDRVTALIDDMAGSHRAAAMKAFARAYLRRVGNDDGVPTDHLFAEVAAAFGLVAGRGRRPVAVRAFTPVHGDHGYEPVGTIVETNTDDLPYLVDSVAAELRARGYGIRRVLHPIIGTERDADGELLRVLDAQDAARRESVMHFELDRRLDEAECRDVEATVARVLDDVRGVVGDFPALTQRVGAMIEYARRGAGRHSLEEVNEAIAFLRWLLEGNFTFLGYREYDAHDGMLGVVPGSGLGLLADTSSSEVAEPTPITELRPAVQDRIARGALLLVTKTNRLSPVHRRARMDYVGVRWVSDDGEHVGEARLLGLFTSRAYAAPAADTPLLHQKLRHIVEAEGLIDGSHDHRAVVDLFSSYPKDELFAARTEVLREDIVTLLALQGHEVRLLVRRSDDGRSASVVAALPPDRYTPRLLTAIQKLLTRRFATGAIESEVVLGERFRHARIHFSVHAPGGLPEVAASDLEAEVVELTRSWDDRVADALAAHVGRRRAREHAAKWAPRLPEFYKVATDPVLAAHDVENLERLETGDEDFVVGLENAEGKSGPRTRLALYKRGGKVPLSEFLPILEALGLRVHDERPTRLQHGNGDTFIQNFGVLAPDGRPLDLVEAGDRVADLITAVRRGEADSDWLNRLVVSAGVTWRQLAVLRAYRTYRQRVGSRFGARYEAEALGAHPEITRKLVDYFELRFDPQRAADPEAEVALRAEILRDLDGVESLDHDRILRDQLLLVDATLRTNAFKPGRGALALKFRSSAVPAMPQPAPMLEVYVNSPQLEGIHLRGGLVARGGLRWSDRIDFRTEVWGLMRAQMTKNAVIVPTGAKGGFFLKRRPEDPAELRAAVEARYREYIRALLDITDNLAGGEVVHPQQVRVLDGDDPYLVVAADKGTATFSDIANRIATDEYGFWLGDAFASGGSEGYDHKRLGITARGAWESVKRHFRELGMDPARDAFTAVGIGDMSGDVFGNGMLLSDRIRLIAAYDHRHVFLDPDPDPESSWRERRRLFDLPRSSWADYDAALISEGGGVWPRTAKAVPLSPRARAALGIDDVALPPDEVIRAILRAPVDLLFNGGIGTVVKATSETHDQARDRASEAIRVDAAGLRCRVVGEGGNLGLTQRARIEFAAGGGRVNADFIDNAAGVDCSDHEVNLKVLLSTAMAAGELDLEGRNALLRAVTDDVVSHVLGDSYRQARILSRETATSANRLFAYEDLMRALEADGIVDRDVDALPVPEALAQRRRTETGLHRPELAVLVTGAKRSLTDALLDSDVVDDPWIAQELRGYFPLAVTERFGGLLHEHRLRRQLVATLVANEVVDALGPSFVSRLATEMGCDAAAVIRAYRVARDVTGAVGRWAAIDALDAALDRDIEAQLVGGIERLVETVTRWYLAEGLSGSLEAMVREGHDGFERLEDALAATPPEAAADVVEGLLAAGVPAPLAEAHALAPELAFAPDVIAVAAQTGREVEQVGVVFKLVGERLRFGWLEAELDELPAGQRTQRWAVQSLRDDAHAARRQLVARALAESPGADPEPAVEAFLARRRSPRSHLDSVVRSLAVDGSDLPGLMIVVRKLRGMAA